jgi:opacity protein-like surface antigen
MRSIFILVVAASLGLSSAAYAESRSLGVPNDKGWQHAQTGIILMSKLGAFQRTDLRDNGTSELDISAAYHGVNPADTASIYLFRPGIASLPMWFDRSHYAMTVNPEIRVGAPLGSIARLALPGSNIESGLRVSYALKDSDEGGTGLAMVPFGDWLIAIRLSSPTMTATEVDAGLLDLVAKIRWPAQPTSGQIVAMPVVACTTSLKTHKAKLIQPDLAQALIGASLSHLADKKAREQSASVRPATYCRQGVSAAEYGMYRSDVATDGYILALGDAGIAASVFPGLSLNNRKEYAVTLTTHDSHDTYPSFNALPDPKQVFTLVTSRGPVSRTNRGGSDIVIAPTGK